MDYRHLNAKTRKDAYPLPRIDESLDALGRARYFSAIDLASAYNQVEVHPDDRHKTAFTTPMGLYEYNRMPFGLCKAPGTFQRLMQTIFREELLQILLVYLDDIIVYSDTIGDHLKRLERVFQRLRESMVSRLKKKSVSSSRVALSTLVTWCQQRAWRRIQQRLRQCHSGLFQER